ncbi:triosephosphate isomerase [Sphingomonadaceae bacterium LXI357]|uniref:Triosephosphate isomerase n=2 Tax=Stakelama marina TaxID=2826939 RepID=A0A8T4IBI3_9SPHN|nr:triosephosphate isomerase [Stakelama marina]
MNGTRAALRELDEIDRAARSASNVDVVIALPFTLLDAGSRRMTAVQIASQDVHVEPGGAHTGCISAPMASDAGAVFTLVGHSETRARGDTSATVAHKLRAATKAGMTPILCVGADLNGQAPYEAFRRLRDEIAPVAETNGQMWVAYEPESAIGADSAADSDQIATVHARLREHLGPSARLLYGGSVNADNIAQILSLPNVDGVLVGRASMQASTFAPMITFADQSARRA